ncbi:protein-tyrosine-phosphatase [Chryseosolibacter indicus]|uniref:Protein-tyrosine-phosphatase n=1 Tax=Chryseosolibacter indicus TaxID=2782351 RepID=A0ABS5VY60_9BACT|nr:protein-tyrosine-phosphatase [Chryseosolibacter indicus]MBT1705787.1 protein-tyrosine-phosphatase [Chryseosolibacter indicus]
MTSIKKSVLLPSLVPTVEGLIKHFDEISVERKQILKQLTLFIENKLQQSKNIDLNFICTHNSRRSHLSQLWAQTAAYYYCIPGVTCYSGGTEATAFNHRAVKAMQEAGFAISKVSDGENPVYTVIFSEEAPGIEAFSKKYSDPINNSNDFAAVMTCSHADENCPFIPGASARIAITYDDPKIFDDTPLEAMKYKERVDQIGTEILFAFSQVKFPA